MTRFFTAFDENLSVEPRVTVQRMDMGGVVVSLLDEGEGEGPLPLVTKDTILLSIAANDHQQLRAGGTLLDAPTSAYSIALVPRGGDPASSWRARHRPLCTVAIAFDIDLFHRFAPEVVTARFAEGHLVPLNFARRDGLAGIAILLARELDGSFRRGRLFAETAMRLLALEIASGFWSWRSQGPESAPFTDRRIRRAIDLIEEHFAEEISTLDLAAASGIGVSALTTQFRKATGKTPYAYVIDRRLDNAVAMLRSTDMPIVEVALASGFADQPHMTRMLRSRRGTTPRAVRMKT